MALAEDCRRKRRGLYLDGGYGVGKTHLLAAAYTACQVDVQRKAYLSFSDLVYAIGLLGVEAFRERIKGYKLYCIDEFELDDPGNTTLIYWFLSHVLSKGAWIITTLNTLPEVQGQGRFNALKFRREIQDLASRFTVVTLYGPDYRQREYPTRLLSEPEIAHLEVSEAFAKPKVSAPWPELFALLRDRHPFRYGHLAEQIGVLYLHEATPIGHPDDALRFVHFIDKFYEFNKSLRMSGNLDLAELFVPSYRDGAFAKKYYRCLSRISELMNDLPVDASARAAFN